MQTASSLFGETICEGPASSQVRDDEHEFDDIGVFAQLVPSSPATNRVFDETFSYLSHAVTPAETIRKSLHRRKMVRRTDKTDGVLTVLRAYELSFEHNMLPRCPPNGWVIGNDRPTTTSWLDDVDFLLIRQESLDLTIPDIACRIFFEDSGLLMLIASSQSHPILFQDEKGRWIELAYGNLLPLSRREQNLRLCGLEYTFRYILPEEAFIGAIMTRDAWLESHCEIKRPGPTIFPFAAHPPYYMLGSMLLTEDIGEGTYGSVRKGIDLTSGERIAIKMIQKDEGKPGWKKEDIIREAELGQRVSIIRNYYAILIW